MIACCHMDGSSSLSLAITRNAHAHAEIARRGAVAKTSAKAGDSSIIIQITTARPASPKLRVPLQ